MPLHYPKVLIIGETFRPDTGGGITLRNLFFNWSSEKLAVITQSEINDYQACQNYYKIGNNENQILQMLTSFFNLGKPNSSPPSPQEKHESVDKFRFKESILDLAKKTSGSISHFLGFHYLLHKINLSDSLHEWIKEFDPDIIYFQPNSLHILELVSQIYNKINRPIAIHIVDDYRKTKNKPGFFYHYFEKKMEEGISEIVNKSNLRFSICEEMSEEYLVRFRSSFIPIHNPIETGKWIKDFKGSNIKKGNEHRIAYAGRIGIANSEAILQLIEVINLLNSENHLIHFDIYSIDHDKKIIKALRNSKHSSFREFVAHKNLPSTLSNYDILFLPLSHSKKSLKFTRLSMPTKVSEYMATGIPIIVYSPPQTALFKYAAKYKWALTTSNLLELKKSILSLVESEELRTKYSKKSKDLASKHHELRYVSGMFQDKIIEVAVKSNFS